MKRPAATTLRSIARGGAALRAWVLRPAAALAAAVVLSGATAGAAAPADYEVARLHYELAVKHFDRGDFAKAIAEFEQAYLLAPSPALLFNIGTCAEKLGDLRKARDSYKAFVAGAPDHPERARVALRVVELEAALEGAGAPAPPTLPEGASAAGSGAGAPSIAAPSTATPSVATSSSITPATAGAAGAPAVGARGLKTPAPAARRGGPDRWWPWAAAAGAVAGGALAVVVAFFAARSPEPVRSADQVIDLRTF